MASQMAADTKREGRERNGEERLQLFLFQQLKTLNDSKTFKSSQSLFQGWQKPLDCLKPKISNFIFIPCSLFCDSVDIHFFSLGRKTIFTANDPSA